MKCPSCFLTYSEEELHSPRILINCGHTYCHQCIQTSIIGKECPDCSADYSKFTSVASFPKNLVLLQYSQEPESFSHADTSLNVSQKETDNSTSKEVCEDHFKPIEAYCPSDAKLVCIDCILTTQSGLEVICLEKAIHEEKKLAME